MIKKLIIVGSSFFHNPNIIASAYDKMSNNTINLDSLVKDKYLNKDNLKISNRIPRLIKNEKIYFLDKIKFFCNESGCSLFYKNKDPKLWDSCHITIYSIKDYGLFIDNQISVILNRSTL